MCLLLTTEKEFHFHTYIFGFFWGGGIQHPNNFFYGYFSIEKKEFHVGTYIFGFFWVEARGFNTPKNNRPTIFSNKKDLIKIS
jgi:hypothetical protein